MKEIPLTQGKVTMVDDEDYSWLIQRKWRANKSTNTAYYAVGTPISGVGEISMQRYIMGTISKDIYIDHRDGNSLNNQKDNLRKCSPRQNSFNRPSKRGSSLYKGVHFSRRENKWRASIWVGDRTKQLGRFETEDAAALAYNAAAEEYFGEFAWFNQVPSAASVAAVIDNNE